MNTNYPFTAEDIKKAVQLELQKIKEPDFQKHAIMIIGQPAAGKSILTKEYISNHINIDADDYRIYHPNYLKINQEQGIDAPDYTSEFSGKVCEKLIEETTNQGLNIIIQGTGRNYLTVKNTAESLIKKGYTVDLKVISCPIELSTVSIYKRYYELQKIHENGRFSNLAHSKKVIENLPKNLDKLHNDAIFKSIEIIDRNKSILWNETEQIKPSRILTHEFTRKLTEEEKYFCEKAEQMIKEFLKDEKEFNAIIATKNKFIKSMSKEIQRKGISR